MLALLHKWHSSLYWWNFGMSQFVEFGMGNWGNIASQSVIGRRYRSSLIFSKVNFYWERRGWNLIKIPKIPYTIETPKTLLRTNKTPENFSEILILKILYNSLLPAKKFEKFFFRFVSFRFISFRFVSFRFVSFRFVSFRFVSFRFVSFRFVSFRFVSIYFVSEFFLFLPFRFVFQTLLQTVQKFIFKLFRWEILHLWGY
jgi:hypothetical protein